MAYIYGRPGQAGHVKVTGRGREMLLRVALPLVFLFLLASMGLQAFLHGFYAVTTFFMVFFVLLLLRFDELGLTLSNHLARKTKRFQSDQLAAQALSLLPDDYHVFHGLDFGSGHIDHAVVGPNGFFLVSTKTHFGKVTVVRDRLRLNGWPFLADPINNCWRQSQTLMKHLDLHASGAIQPSPVLCFSHSSVAADRYVRGVMVAQADTLTRMLQEQESSLPNDKILQLTALLAPLVRVKQWENGAAGLQENDEFGTNEVTRKGPVFACAKCHHVPSDLEAELFPGECPRCRRLHSGARGSVTDQGVLRPALAHILLTSISVTLAVGLLAYQAGLLDQTQSAAMVPPVTVSPPPATPHVDQPPNPHGMSDQLPSASSSATEQKTADKGPVSLIPADRQEIVANPSSVQTPAPAPAQTGSAESAQPPSAPKAPAADGRAAATTEAANATDTASAPSPKAATSCEQHSDLQPFEGP